MPFKPLVTAGVERVLNTFFIASGRLNLPVSGCREKCCALR
jgi:ubiquinone biosynthesis protein UbiJ